MAHVASRCFMKSAQTKKTDHTSVSFQCTYKIAHFGDITGNKLNMFFSTSAGRGNSPRFSGA